VTTSDLCSYLLSTPAQIEEAERNVIAAQEAARKSKEQLEDREAELIVNSELINGKNAEQRAAQVRALTMGLREILARSEARERSAVVALHRLQNEFSAFKSVARLMEIRE
jgi:hypothetical protein